MYFAYDTGAKFETDKNVIVCGKISDRGIKRRKFLRSHSFAITTLEDGTKKIIAIKKENCGYDSN